MRVNCIYIVLYFSMMNHLCLIQFFILRVGLIHMGCFHDTAGSWVGH